MAARWRLRHLPYRAQIGSCLFIVGGFLVGDVGGAFVADVGEVAGGVVWVPAALVNLAVAKSEVIDVVSGIVGPPLLWWLRLGSWCAFQYARANSCRRLFDHGFTFVFFAFIFAARSCIGFAGLFDSDLQGEGASTSAMLTLWTFSNPGSPLLTVTQRVCGRRERSE